MKFRRLFLVVLFILAVSGLVLGARLTFADDEAMNKEMANDMDSDDPIEVGNTHCPVDGMALEAGKEHQAEYRGKIYNVCSPDCEKKFLENPEMYIEKMETMEGEDSKDGMDDSTEGMQGMEGMDGKDAGGMEHGK